MTTIKRRMEYLAEVEKTVELAKTQIKQDISSGIIPETVKDFSELHDYVDANGYGSVDGVRGTFDGPHSDPNSSFDATFWNDVQAQLDAWLKGGRQ